MKLGLLYKDELIGFFKSKLTIFLWIGMPLLVIIVYLIQPQMEGMGFTSLAAMLMASLGGSVSGVLLSVTVRSELNAKVFDLFLVRPVKRQEIILAKFLALLTCMAGAVIFSLVLGISVDAIKNGAAPNALLAPIADTIVLTMSAIAISAALGLLFGLLINSVPASAIISFYLCNQISGVILSISILVKLPMDIKLFSGLSSLALTAILLIVSILIFNRKRM